MTLWIMIYWRSGWRGIAVNVHRATPCALCAGPLFCPSSHILRISTRVGRRILLKGELYDPTTYAQSPRPRKRAAQCPATNRTHQAHRGVLTILDDGHSPSSALQIPRGAVLAPIFDRVTSARPKAQTAAHAGATGMYREASAPVTFRNELHTAAKKHAIPL